MTYLIMHHEHEKANSRRKGVKGEVQKEGRQGDAANAKQTGIAPPIRSSPPARENQRGIPEFRTWVSKSENTRPPVKERAL